MKHMASVKKKSSSRDRSKPSKRARVSKTTEPSEIARRVAKVLTEEPLQHFVVCLRNDAYPASLELRKIYPALQDNFAEEHNLIRVIDESGEDYLYPANYFLRLELPAAVKQELIKIA